MAVVRASADNSRESPPKSRRGVFVVPQLKATRRRGNKAAIETRSRKGLAATVAESCRSAQFEKMSRSRTPRDSGGNKLGGSKDPAREVPTYLLKV
ncbi:hypothetical protein N7499_009206 [Penicillium canescens]|uniref:Uncharacterized protein n=1 Tax=Penicillium canescens TaxID=5083 RepID=A0AAD6INZ3_PENCN|nr:uncharacterized protein N7446_008768 [Penicillium canescens]KAJ5981740.1 hypothetical protein N7522_013368 [Penicillium canescens]KAJ6032939.1 hypothetical protein N7444_010710 [Penicillium canescens]KAJ6057871.1 hypothetical protein N7460_001145 [Penicillium canescens]KAJ6059185.1 hypothetical protein N7446_008768 [Penicillium canescens]KAJ6071192.1 hypothetical protein N7499_009206 [Penicillium canescens]